MASNLLKKSGAALNIYDVSTSALSDFTSKHSGAKVTTAKSPKEVAEKSSVVFTMLPSSPHVLKVYLEGKDSLLNVASKGQLFVDASTISQEASLDVYKEIQKKGAGFIDAPVSGGVNGATAGTLTFMVGAEKVHFDQAKPYLEMMGKNIVHCGQNGNGLVAKICNNMLLGISMVATAETLNLGKRMGMDPKLLSEIMATSSGRNWSLDTYNPVPGIMPNVPSSKEYKGGFAVELMTKDMGLAAQAAIDSHTPCFLGEVSRSIYQKTGKELSGKDFSVVYKWLSGS